MLGGLQDMLSATLSFTAIAFKSSTPENPVNTRCKVDDELHVYVTLCMLESVCVMSMCVCVMSMCVCV